MTTRYLLIDFRFNLQMGRRGVNSGKRKWFAANESAGSNDACGEEHESKQEQTPVDPYHNDTTQ